MENASKALIMAGSVLVSVLIIGLLVTMFNNLSNTKSTEQEATETESITQFNARYEAYNRKMLYGTDIISLANLVKDDEKYNADGYSGIKVQITIKKMTNYASKYSSTYANLFGENKDAVDISNDIENLNGDINNRKNNKTTYFLFGLKSDGNVDKGNKLSFEAIDKKGKKEVQEIEKVNDQDKVSEYEKYCDLKDFLKDFKRDVFKCQSNSISYDNNGRITTMNFTDNL